MSGIIGRSSSPHINFVPLVRSVANACRLATRAMVARIHNAHTRLRVEQHTCFVQHSEGDNALTSN
jgi:hypothetical protein